MSRNIEIRRAREIEADVLSELAVRSKAHWGYSAAFMKACREELAVSPSDLRSSRSTYFVAEIGNEIVGFYGLMEISTTEYELEALFVAPQHIGKGAGRRLVLHARRTAKNLGAVAIIIQGDPNADGFYRRVGAKRVGKKESESILGRQLPLYRLDLREARRNVA